MKGRKERHQQQAVHSKRKGRSWTKKNCVERHLESSKAMLQCAQGLIKNGRAGKDIEEITSGQVLLAEANASLSQNMQMLTNINEKLQKLRNRCSASQVDMPF